MSEINLSICMSCLHFFDTCPDPAGRGLGDTVDARRKWNIRKCKGFEPYNPWNKYTTTPLTSSGQGLTFWVWLPKCTTSLSSLIYDVGVMALERAWLWDTCTLPCTVPENVVLDEVTNFIIQNMFCNPRYLAFYVLNKDALHEKGEPHGRKGNWRNMQTMQTPGVT